MTTKKIYYDNPYIRTFTTNVQKLEKDEQGRLYAVLDSTAFYPTGGGQPHDSGTINDVPVYEVEEVEGEIRHFLKEPINTLAEVTAEIDWERRFDHMQQHAGQHILSAAFEELYDFKTVSFHLGQDLCTIDLATATLSETEALMTEQLANAVITENRPIETKWVSEEELSAYALRKELSVSTNIRLVIIPDFDYNGCGGTHPASTGQVNSIKILHWEKQKKNIRVYFVCGLRVIKQLHEKHRVIQNLTGTLNAPQEQLNEAAARLLLQTKELEKTVDELKKQLAAFEAEQMLKKAEILEGVRLVKAVFAGRPVSELQQLAKSIAASTNDSLVLFVNDTEQKLQLVGARSEGTAIKVNELIKQVLPAINGKGGGTASFAQGGGDKLITAEQLLDKLLDQVNVLPK